MEEKQKKMMEKHEAIEQARLRYYELLESQKDSIYEEEPEMYRQHNSEQINEYLDDIQARNTRKATATGFNRLDGLLDGGFYSGLYVLGALSSLGKTSFALEIAKNIAARGEDVLYLSYEMSGFELYSRLTSRISVDKGLKLSTRDVMNGSFIENEKNRKTYIESHSEYYEKISPNLFLIEEELGKSNVVDVSQRIKYHIKITNKRPIVIVDYLQLLTPIDIRATDKQNMDKVITQLKQISRDESLTILAISSLNRNSYKNRISFEAFKESGAIEYSSDVVIGLQIESQGRLSGSDEEKAKQYEKEMSFEEKPIELIVLKNRTGRRGSIYFDYNCKHNYWKEREKQ